jgi:hypothetical protein
MSKLFTTICASLCALSFSAAYADAPMEDSVPEAMPEFPITETLVQMPTEETPAVISEPIAVEVEQPKAAPIKIVAEKKPEVSVNPFTGKIKGKKVRMRLRPDLDSRIIKELTKNEMITVVGEKGDFWAVQAPSDTKAFIFRSFVLDNVVEGNHVNIRLEPSLDAPVIAHLDSGEKLENPSVSPVNPKWLEIAPPKNTKFYIAKDYVEYAGGPEVKEQMDRRFATAEQLLESTTTLGKIELQKSFDDVDFDRIVKGFNTVVNDFTDFPELSEQAKDALAIFQEEYLQKRIAHTESHPADRFATSDSKQSVNLEKFENIAAITDKMKSWNPIEEALYLSWANINDNKTQRDYYEEQRLAAVEISGIVEPYTSPVKSKPGDFIIRENDVPVGYVYSTQVNLQSLIGKHVKLVAAQRPNNNFAFPAYYVLAVE